MKYSSKEDLFSIAMTIFILSVLLTFFKIMALMVNPLPWRFLIGAIGLVGIVSYGLAKSISKDINGR